MNAKFYVPFETAKLLRANGYPQSGSDMYYDLSGNLTPDNGFIPIDDDVCAAAPAYCEVLDWMEKKGNPIEVMWVREHSDLVWSCIVCGSTTRNYPTREQAINAAIVRVLEEMI